MSSLFTPRFHLKVKDWKQFQGYVNETYPKDHFTKEQKDFCLKALLQDSGNCPDVNKLWINVFCDMIVDCIGEGFPIDAGVVSEQIERLRAMMGKAILNFYNAQFALRENVPHNSRTPEQVHMLEVHPNIVNMPIELVLDMGRLLNLKSRHGSGGALAAEGSAVEGDEVVQNQQLFYLLHEKMIAINRSAATKGGEAMASATTGAGSATAAVGETSSQTSLTNNEWHAHGAEHTYMRLCCYKVWCDKYENEEEWNPASMVGPWLQEGICMYNNLSYHWNHCNTKKYPESQYEKIRHTAINSWLHDVAHRAGAGGGTGGKVRQPTTNFITDWCTPPVTEKRHDWEIYFCSVMLNAKNLSKMLNKKVEHIPEKFFALEESQEQAAVSSTPAKRKRGAGAQQATEEVAEESMDDKIRRIVKEEFYRLERLIVRTERNAEARQLNILQEMAAHFSPVNTQLAQLSGGQGFICQAVDRISVPLK